ncbi:MAG: undecaprenyldiphospho-muramoylpentapeptide beta-N-acetylglucosaminyltransferase [Oscillospiraceae bacterium]|jgi:UDP-N-acetylglucosamine--N-acetylmuramyl-(pentapeptide) pyrophosphoryl-undecaprenol N-acetylglucosamine transferase|nr:undecaprenyldiphospho-muramoylpentapeptide beta-N-acetylglucosaminyltransferase [Oscillospiraceae bacterium]MCI9549951.1 undecaprenyldiphospho-muramoylpentapeptide beta-N-acetylglucosaminyltransferase [Oscillospiraceae bacterium]
MRVIFTCGGSAGHVNPALAVAQQFEAHHPGCEILFVGAERGMEQRLVKQAGYPIETVKVSTFERSWSWKVIKHNVGSALKLPVGQYEAASILKKFRPDLVVGTGGYASYPAVHEAARRRIPCAIHESNAYPGLTTRALANQVGLVMVGFPEAAAYYKDAKRVAVTGTPVRGEFFTLDREQARLRLGLLDSQPLVISFWGSQGAGHMSEKTVDFVERWAAEGRQFHYIHAAGRDYEDMTAGLARRGVSVTDREIRPYIDDMPVVMAAADLVICRAGASTIGELTALGKPAILVPSPFVAANHQFKNAKVLCDRGGVELMEEKECTGEGLYRAAMELLANGARRAAMGRALRELAAPHAAQDIYENLVKLMK